MKLIPCPHCRRTAVGQSTAAFPDGAPVIMGRFTGGAFIVVKCFRCKRAFKLDVGTFHSLPETTADERKSLGRTE